MDVQDEFERWARAREDAARRDFDEMLKENRYDTLVIFSYDSRHLTLACPPFASFVEFWGRARKLGGDDAKRAEEDEVRVHLPSVFPSYRR